MSHLCKFYMVLLLKIGYPQIRWFIVILRHTHMDFIWGVHAPGLRSGALCTATPGLLHFKVSQWRARRWRRHQPGTIDVCG